MYFGIVDILNTVINFHSLPFNKNGATDNILSQARFRSDGTGYYSGTAVVYSYN